MAEVYAIGLMADTGNAYGRGIAQGVTDYVNGFSDGRLLVQLPFDLRDLGALARWPFAGLIIQVQRAYQIKMVHDLGLPAVNVSAVISPGEVALPTVYSDNVAVGRVAGEYFLQRGFEHFAFLGDGRLHFSMQRCQGFAAAVRKAGFTVQIYDREVHDDAARVTPPRPRRGQPGLCAWLLELPKPAALLAGNDLRAADALWACERVGIPVPDMVSVLGVDDDPWVHRLVPLSSVPQPGVKVGFEAARLLDRLRAGERAPADPILIAPEDPVVTRHSTSALPIRDPDIARALRYIRLHADRPIAVEDILDQIALTRRTFERRFRAIMGCSPLEEIQRVHLERAKDLLAKTDLPVPKIAQSAGFGNTNRFGITFKSHTGCTPTQYRRQFRPT